MASGRIQFVLFLMSSLVVLHSVLLRSFCLAESGSGAALNSWRHRRVVAILGQRSLSAGARLFVLVLFLILPARAQVEIQSIARANDSVTLSWQGGQGPYLVETSANLANWSDQGEPGSGTTRTLPAFSSRRFYRVIDLDPSAQYGNPFGLIQTEQGEFGELLGRHRLKTRLWLYRTKGVPHTSVSYIPANYWRKLLINYQHLEGDRVRTWAGPLESLGSIATPASQRLTVTWIAGSGADQRSFELTLEFPYPVNATRSITPFPSDPTYALKCTYATPQPERDWSANGIVLKSTTTDSIGLVQLDPTSDPANPDQSWWVKRYTVAKNGVKLNLHFFEGLPLYRGEPPWIFKTLLLDRWRSPTTGGGGSLPALSTDSYFARTLLPGHHNFWEEVLIEPVLDPAISEAARAALAQANIRQIYTFKDIAGVSSGGDGEDIRYLGYDNSIREP